MRISWYNTRDKNLDRKKCAGSLGKKKEDNMKITVQSYHYIYDAPGNLCIAGTWISACSLWRQPLRIL